LCEINNYKQVKQTPPENDVQVLDVSWLKKKGTRWEMLGEEYVQDTQIAAVEVVAKVQHFC